jgi:hypothetical protein
LIYFHVVSRWLVSTSASVDILIQGAVSFGVPCDGLGQLAGMAVQAIRTAWQLF